MMTHEEEKKQYADELNEEEKRLEADTIKQLDKHVQETEDKQFKSGVKFGAQNVPYFISVR